jgi:hypothetical protein
VPIFVRVDEASNQAVERQPIRDELAIVSQASRIGVALEYQSIRVVDVLFGGAIVGRRWRKARRAPLKAQIPKDTHLSRP